MAWVDYRPRGRQRAMGWRRIAPQALAAAKGGAVPFRRNLWLVLLLLGVLLLWVVRETDSRGQRAQLLQDRSGVRHLPGLRGRVLIQRDGAGVPHIRVERVADAYYALGYCHAQDRMAQMEWMRRLARGRSAEWVGPSGLPADRLARTLGLARHAELQAQRLAGPVRRALEAYAAGVNARIGDIRAGRSLLHPALQALGAELEPWTAADSIAVVKQWGWGLGVSIEAPLVLWDLVRLLGGRDARPFFPAGAAAEIDPLFSPGGGSIGAPSTVAYEDPLRRALGLRGSAVGSSAWLVGGALTNSGGVYLAGDFHTEATAPALFYEAHWRGGGRELAGATVPGAPVFWSGHNGHVSWVATEARAAGFDLYWETLHPIEDDSYWGEGGWTQLIQRRETIAVRGAPGEELRVRETVRGPLIHELLPVEREPIAVAWPGGVPGDGISALLRATRARDAESFRRALGDHHEPTLVFLFADREGRGGLQVAGFAPRRSLHTGRLPVQGRVPGRRWLGRVPLDELPHVSLRGDTAWIVAADNLLADGSRQDPVEWWWRPGMRARRIDQLLRAARRRTGGLELRDMAAMQRDTSPANVEARVRRVLELAGDPERLPSGARRVYALLKDWDGDMAADRTAAAAWRLLADGMLELFAKRTGPELLERYLSLRGVSAELLLDPLLETQASEGRAKPSVETGALRRAVRGGMQRASLELRARFGSDPSRWRWGLLHQLTFHPPALGSLGRSGWPRLRFGPYEYGGDALTVAVGEYRLGRSYDVQVISAYQVALDAANPALALSSLVPGVTETPEDPLAGSGLERWLAGRPKVFTTHSALIDEVATAELLLLPPPTP